MTYEHIQVTTNDELILNGLFQSGDKNKEASILIHGFTSDFYSHKFYHAIAQKLKESQNALILAQTRGTGMHTEFMTRGNGWKYLGSFYETLEEAHLDISAFVKYLADSGYQKINLIGHSLGTIKIIRYLFEGEHNDKINKLILLAPFDKNVFMEIKAPGKWQEFVQVAKEKIDRGEGESLVPVPGYEDFPITYNTFYSWYQPTEINQIFDFYKTNYQSPILKKINIPVKVILGERDEFVNYPKFQETATIALTYLKNQIPNCQTHIVKNAEHAYVGHEDEVSTEVSNFLDY